jgi:hypothetical protein
MEATHGYVARCPSCKGMTDAVVIRAERPEFWTRTVANWGRRKVTPIIEQDLIETIRTLPFCHCKGKAVS